VWQPVDANDPVVHDLTSAENIPNENSIADKQISYATLENGTTDNIDFKTKG